MKKQTRKVNMLALSVIAGGTALATAAPAVAQGINFGIWGNDGGSSTENLSSDSVNWFSVSARNGNTAWENFRKFSGLEPKYLDGELNELEGFDRKVCEKSNTIWYTVNNNNGSYYWVNTINGTDKRTILTKDGKLASTADHKAIGVNGTVLNPALTYGVKPTQKQIDAMIKEYGTAKLNSQPWTLVCSGSLVGAQPQGNKWTEYKDKDGKATRDRNDALEKTRATGKVKSWTNPINVNLIAKPDFDPGKIALQSQSKANVTQFGNLWKQAQAEDLNGKSIEDVNTLVESAMSKDKAASYEMDLNDQNKEAIAEGGVMSINQFNQPGTITVRETETVIEKRTCEKKYELENEEWVPSTTCSGWGEEKVGVGSTVSTTNTTQNNVGFWQILVVQCNPEEFNKVKSALKTDVVSSELVNQGEGSAGVIKTIMYNDTTQKKLGNPSQTDGVLRRTAQNGFYDKECGLQCYAPPTSRVSGGDDGRIQPNELPAYSPGKDGGTGVKISDDSKFDGKNLAIFRDNDPKRTITINLWRPEIAPKATPKTTTVFKDPNGTPGADGSAGEFVMTDSKKNSVFGSDSVAEQKGWDKATFKSPNVSVLDGSHNVFNVRANWPSEKGNPQVLNAAWEYDVTGKADIPTTVGVSKNVSTPVMKNVGTVEAPIEGRCFAMFNSNAEDLGSEYLNANTGSGTSSGFENPFAYKTEGDERIYNNPYNIVIDFVRATAE